MSLEDWTKPRTDEELAVMERRYLLTAIMAGNHKYYCSMKRDFKIDKKYWSDLLKIETDPDRVAFVKEKLNGHS